MTADSISRPVDLSHFLNNAGSSSDGKVDGDGFARGETFPAAYLPTGPWLHDGIEFQLPSAWGQGNDNVKCNRQTIPLDAGQVLSVHLLAAGDDPRGECVDDKT